MLRLALTLFSMIATTAMGIGVIAVLTMGYDTLMPILVGAGIGLIAAIPSTWYITRQIEGGS